VHFKHIPEVSGNIYPGWHTLQAASEVHDLQPNPHLLHDAAELTK
jgi:hypothetical protein